MVVVLRKRSVVLFERNSRESEMHGTFTSPRQIGVTWK
jgi:hypothetical protein